MILIALGANLPSFYGSPEDTLKAAMDFLDRDGMRLVKSSRLWLSAPVPASEQPWYHNAVVQVETALSAQALLRALQKIESVFGRVRTERNAPRVLDLDLIAYNDEVMEKEGLHVPHPRLYMRGFVLYPLREVCPGWTHPVLGLTVEDMIRNLPESQQLQPLKSEAA